MTGSWMRLRDKVAGFLTKRRGNDELLKLAGTYHVKHYRKGVLIAEWDQPNLITTVGRNHILNTQFAGGTPVTTWYIGLVNNSGWTAFAAGDTMGSHAGWTELEDYDEATRQAWTEDAAASGSMTNSTPAVFTINATVTIKGIFLTSVSTKGGTTGTLWCGTAFSSPISAEDDDVLSVTYTVNTA